MDKEKRTQLKHDKMIAEAEEDIREGRIYSQAAVKKIIQSWTKKDFETGKSLMEALEMGEKSGFVKDFDAVENLKKIHEKHLIKSK